ncbi:MAG: DUF4917 family protein [Elainellaceae cyanobacterium]
MIKWTKKANAQLPQDYLNVDPQLSEWSEIEKDFVGGGLLMGNGFSQAVWEKFGYQSIYKAACDGEYTNHPLIQEDIHLFQSMNTSNFEMVLSHLSAAIRVNKIFGIEYSCLDKRHEHIKNALGEAIKAVHVPWELMSDKVLLEIRNELRRYGCVYSTNYDVLPYWAIMQKPKGEGFKDFFWNPKPLPGIEQDQHFDIANSDFWGSSTKILYLHGGLHLYRDFDTKRTYKFVNKKAANLLNITKVPLFITEGSSEDKLKAIRESDYLNFAYSQLLRHSESLVIFGHSLSDSDQHLIDAIRKSNTKKIAISIRKSNTPEAIMHRKAKLIRDFCDGLRYKDKPQIFFFDAQTHPLGSSNIRVDEEAYYARPF